MNRVIHFELTAENMDRMVEFYQSVFGWKATKWEGPMDYWLVQTGEDSPGIDGGFMKKSDNPNPVCNTIGVEDIDAMIEKVTQAGGEIVAPKMTIPTVGYFAYFKDTEGNISGLMQNDPEAK